MSERIWAPWRLKYVTDASKDSEDFYAVVGVMVVLLVAMLAFFRRRGWL